MSHRLPTLRLQQVLCPLQQAGFSIHHTTGGHYVLKHPDKTGLCPTVPYHNKDLKRRIRESIIVEAEMTVEQVLGFL